MFSGSALAIACSYLFEQGDEGESSIENNVYIRFVTDQETKPK
jgi:cell cycle arrest protein BUB3